MHTDSDTATAEKDVAAPASSTTSANITTTAPGQIRVIKRNGTVVAYTSEKIAVAMTKAFLAVEGGTAAASNRIRETVEQLSDVGKVLEAGKVTEDPQDNEDQYRREVNPDDL